MKYEIYLQKDVSIIVNEVSKALGKKPSTMIKEMLESNFRNAYKDTLKLSQKGNEQHGLKNESK